MLFKNEVYFQDFNLWTNKRKVLTLFTGDKWRTFSLGNADSCQWYLPTYALQITEPPGLLEKTIRVGHLLPEYRTCFPVNSLESLEQFPNAAPSAQHLAPSFGETGSFSYQTVQKPFNRRKEKPSPSLWPPAYTRPEFLALCLSLLQHQCWFYN